MALSFTRISWLWLGGKEKEVSNGSVVNSINSLGDRGLGLRGEPENLRFYSVKGGGDRRLPTSSTSNRKAKRKWKSREDRSQRIDKEHDALLVPSDGVCLSGSESDDSDWSIGWMEPHAPSFQSDDDEVDDSFAVIVRCYRNDSTALEEKEEPGMRYFNAVKNLPGDYSAGGKL